MGTNVARSLKPNDWDLVTEDLLKNVVRFGLPVMFHPGIDPWVY